MPTTHRRLLLAAAVALAAAPALAADRPAAPRPAALRRAAPSSAVRTLVVTARDYAFEAPDTAYAGRTAIRLTSLGAELHHVWLVRLDAGHTPAEFLEALGAGGPLPAWAHEAGGPNAPTPGQTSTAVVDLKAGTHVLVCVIPGPDGKPHVMKGMSRALTVVPAPAAATPVARARGLTVPAPDVTMTLTDYGFQTSRAITAGRHVVRVTNVASQPHEVFIARLAPGKSVQDALGWLEKMDGPPPLQPMGGTAGMARGVSNDLLLDLPAGEYGLFCFVPDVKDGKPHVAHGMVRQISVR